MPRELTRGAKRIIDVAAFNLLVETRRDDRTERCRTWLAAARAP